MVEVKKVATRKVVRRVKAEKAEPGAAKVKGSIITPAQLAACGTEHGEQVALMQWVAIEALAKFPQLRLLHAIPNGGDRQAHVGAAMKAEGVKKGVPDLCLPVPMGKVEETWTGLGWVGYHGLYIEMKTPKAFARKDKGCSEEQMRWHRDLLEEGYAVSVAAGWQAAAWVLTLYMRGKLLMPEEGPLLASAVDIEPVLD